MEVPEFRRAVEETLEDLRIGVALAAARQKRAISQTALARSAMTTQPQIARIEGGQVPGIPILRRILAALDAELRMGPDGGVEVRTL
jgi:predicted transcriptional regulator